MTKTPFGKTGFQISPLAYGAAEIGFLNTDRQRASRVLNELLDQGVNVIDTAAGYHTSEEVVGEAISHRRKQFVLISKCGNPASDLKGVAWSKSLILQSVDRSLRRLKSDILDVMLLHSCDEATLRKGEALGALVQARDAGKIRFLGYSGDNEAAAYAASLPEVAVIQTSINIVDQANIDAVLPVARKNNVGVMAKRAIANACWKDLNAQPGMFKEYTKDYSQRLARMKITPADLGLTDSAETAWPELALRFTLSQGGVHTCLIGTTNPDNARRNVEAARKGPLPKEAIEKIRAAFRAGQGNEHWEGLR